MESRTPVTMAALLAAYLSACGGGSSGAGTSSTVPPPAGSTPIAAIQGNAASSPLEGQIVTIGAIVSGDFQDNDADTLSNLGGFYVQQENSDGVAATSDGLFVFDGSNPSIDVNVGDRVVIEGTVSEFFGETQLQAATVDVIGSGTVEAIDLSLPAAATTMTSDGDPIADLERYEGMLVRFPQTLTVTNVRSLEAFGEVALSSGGRLVQFTNANTPNVAGYATHKTKQAARTVLLDDGRRDAGPKPIRHLRAGAADFPLRNGDTIAGLVGNLRYARGSGGNGDEGWRLMPTISPQFANTNPRPGAPTIAGETRVASFNVLNYFSTIDNGQTRCGPQGNDNCRGADSSSELARQTEKTVSALAILDADVVGLIELENNASASLEALVNALNQRGGHYDFVNTGTLLDDAIKTGFIYKASTVQPVGSSELLHGGIDPRFNDDRNRPALAQSFQLGANGAVFTVVVNHLKSKGSSCDAEGDPNLSDGQGNCNRTRTDAAAALADWVQTDPTGSGDDDVLIIGDLNAYRAENPLSALTSSGLVNLLDAHAEPYSFVFDGQAGALDHALATPGLAAQVRETVEWHINADEPPVLDYNLENKRNPNLFDGTSPYRASDHDPVVIGLDLEP